MLDVVLRVGCTICNFFIRASTFQYEYSVELWGGGENKQDLWYKGPLIFQL